MLERISGGSGRVHLCGAVLGGQSTVGVRQVGSDEPMIHLELKLVGKSPRILGLDLRALGMYVGEPARLRRAGFPAEIRSRDREFSVPDPGNTGAGRVLRVLSRDCWTKTGARNGQGQGQGDEGTLRATSRGQLGSGLWLPGHDCRPHHRGSRSVGDAQPPRDQLNSSGSLCPTPGASEPPSEQNPPRALEGGSHMWGWFESGGAGYPRDRHTQRT